MKRSVGRFALFVFILLTVFYMVPTIHKFAKYLADISWTEKSKYQSRSGYYSFFLTDGQIYIGKISRQDDREINIKDVYYAISDQGVVSLNNYIKGIDFSLVRVGREIHGPENSVVLNRKKVIFYKNLAPEGKLAEAIKNVK